jgi:branched-subunit amino acid aminotransferase/4-amino-4-deoxychorismate lyase
MIVIERLPFSWIKSTSALSYVIVGMEKVERNLDDLILCNSDGFVVEGSYSCLFWAKDGILFVTDKCLGGLESCMKSFLTNYWRVNNFEVKEERIRFEEILKSDWIGFGSATGIRIWTSEGKIPDLDFFPAQFRLNSSIVFNKP